jgi:hypothetical protein
MWVGGLRRKVLRKRAFCDLRHIGGRKIPWEQGCGSQNKTVAWDDQRTAKFFVCFLEQVSDLHEFARSKALPCEGQGGNR